MDTPDARTKTEAAPIRSQLAKFCVSTGFEDLPLQVVEFAKLCWIDQIGLMVALCGTYIDDYPDLGEFMCEFGGRGESTVVGVGRKIPALHATIANTAVGVNDHIDGVHKTTIIHMAAALFPALLAIAEHKRSDGRKLIEASVVGAEVMLRFGIAMGARETYARGFHPTAVYAPLGSAAGVSKLLGLGEVQTAEALSLASVQAAGSSVWAGATVPSGWSFQVARAAEGGVLAALMAERGFTGVEKVFEEDRGFLQAYSTASDPAKLTKGLGKSFEITEVSFKRVGVGVYAMTSIEGFIELLESNNLEPDDIEHVTVKLPTVVVPLVGSNKYPQNRAATHLNVRYILAVTAYQRSGVFYNMTCFGAEVRDDPKIQALFRKVDIVGDVELDSVFPEKKACVLSVKTVDGRIVTLRNDGPFRGDPANPLTEADLIQKFNKMTVPILGAEKSDRLLSMLKDLEKLDDATRITELLGEIRTAAPLAAR
ncbi:MAG: MmgE/PrpD family protein [Hyphomicrobiaceae bacterium]|nr:MmgE/PrpD family protein [Hyphomicrobiaceae bacterium]